MQRAPVTVEEQLLQKAIKEECPWENLPKRIQLNLSSKEEWHRRMVLEPDGGYHWLGGGSRCWAEDSNGRWVDLGGGWLLDN
ncbi:hypothetical protein PIB30_046759 [Stylosanthes scabra]|uniref:Uncharacterized protein n=1 Tax=Stylosanthes scabra TaxID=79078 RepID=A0ABU6VHI5_9FABA|nr:hypothetical protein [Stylosanthes scabra]